jgi:hypothetical protein
MTFLNAALLAGLAAVAIPLIIHLFNRRRFPKIDFSTLRFLKRLQRQQMRRLKLRQWLLLLLRMLGIFLIALAFARPTFTARSGFGELSAGRVGMAIVIDGSAGMQARSPAGSTFQEAKAAVEALLATMNASDRALVVLALDKPMALTSAPGSDTEVLRRALSEAHSWDGRADLYSAVSFAAEALKKSPDFRSEIFVISDFAGAPPLPPPPQGMIPFFLGVHPESTDNLAISEVRITGEIIEPGRPVVVEVTLVNHGRRDRENVYYSLFLNDTRVAEDVVSLAAGSEVHRQHEILVRETGLQDGVAQIEDLDALALDNKAYFCFAVPERVNVLLVGDPSAIRLLELALTPLPDEQKLISVQTADRDKWDTGSLSTYDAVIFSDPPVFTSAQAARLARAVENGLGLMIFPGSRTDLASVNRELLARLGTPQWGEILGRAASPEAFLSWQDPDLDQPLLNGMLRIGHKPSLPRFYQAVRFVGGHGEVPLSFRNGMPFLSQTTFGLGRVILVASSPEAAWSDWSQRGIFAPLIHRLTLNLASGQKERCRSLIVEDDLNIPAGNQGAVAAALTLPDAQEIKLPPRTNDLKVGYVYPRVNPAGIYHLKVGSSQYIAAVNVPASESDLTTPNLSETYPDWKAAGVVFVDPKDVAATLKTSRYGRELWKVALIAGLLILFMESLLGSNLIGKSTDNQEL